VLFLLKKLNPRPLLFKGKRRGEEIISSIVPFSFSQREGVQGMSLLK